MQSDPAGAASAELGTKVPWSIARLVSIFQGSFFKSVAAMFAGSLVAHVANLVAAPILTRIFTPEAFGALGMFNYVVSLLGPVAALCYPIAIVLAKDEAGGSALVRLSIAITAVVSTLLLAVLLLFGKQFAGLASLQPIAPFLLLLPLAVLTTGLMQTAQQWATWKEAFNRLSRASAAHSILVNAFRIGLGSLLPVAGVLIMIGTVAPAVLAAMIAWSVPGARRTLFGDAGGERRGDAIAHMAQTAQQFRSFPLLRVPQNIVSAMSLGIPLIFLARYSDAAAAGHFTLAMQVLMLPSLFIGSAVVSVFYPRYARAAREGGQSSYLIRTTLGMTGLGLAPYLTLYLWGPELFELVFGGVWRQAGEFASSMSIWLFFAFASRPSINAIAVLRLERLLLAWELANITAVIATLYFGFQSGASAVQVILLYSLTQAAMNLALVVSVQVASARTSVS